MSALINHGAKCNQYSMHPVDYFAPEENPRQPFYMGPDVPKCDDPAGNRNQFFSR
jgi:hypothetical protein